KHFLNAQYKASLASLNSDGAIIITDYKIQILLKTAKETKQEFFVKRK
ncbi:1607_t:CDS:1, partial [Scutellospora calospora]